jgi:prepilin-type processing-associated H-X9-DG protein
MEQDNIYKTIPLPYFDLNGTAIAWAYWGLPGNPAGVPSPANKTNIQLWSIPPIKSYACPSDNLDFVPTVLPSGFGGYIDAFWTENPNQLWIDFLYPQPPDTNPFPLGPPGGSNYIASSGALGDDSSWVRWKGIYYKNSKTKVGDVTDGTSSTIAFGETLVGPPPASGGIRDWQLTWAGSGCMPSAWGLSPIQGQPYEFLNYSSKHPSVVNFAFADGSVHSLSTTIDLTTFTNLTGMGDGFVINVNKLGF